MGRPAKTSGNEHCGTDPDSLTIRLHVQLIAISLESGATKVLIEGRNTQAAYLPIISPDSINIAFLEQDPRFETFYPLVLRLAILEIDSRVVTTVEAGDRAAARGIRWDADGRTFEFIERDGYGNFVNTVDAQSGRIVSRVPKEHPSFNGFALESTDHQLSVTIAQESPFERTIVSVAHGRSRRAPQRYLMTDSTSGYATGRTEHISWRSTDGLSINGFLSGRSLTGTIVSTRCW